MSFIIATYRHVSKLNPLHFAIFRHILSARGKNTVKTGVIVAKKVSKKIGRPPAGKDKRERRGILTASDAEWVRLQRNAKAAGETSVIVWLRKIGLGIGQAVK